MSESTVYRWPDEVRQAVRLMAGDGLVTALHLRRRALAKAMLVKVRGLDTDDERLRQQTATEIIEWELGKATQPNKNEESGDLVIRVIRDQYEPKHNDSHTGAASSAAEDGE